MDNSWIIIVTIIAVLIIIAIIVAVIARVSHDKGDYRDGGGKQIGGNQSVSFFAPANDRAGVWGERVVNYHLRPLLRDDEYLIANLLIPLRNGHKIEIDCVLISRKGIFCVETKNWVGHISGDDNDEYWYQEYDYPYMADRTHKNPVRQNETHCDIIRIKLHNRIPVKNIVIFADLEDGWGIRSEHAYTISSFKERYRSLPSNAIKQEELSPIFRTLLPYVATEEQLRRHKEEIQRNKQK